MSQVRLNKFIADTGICSRRGADEHILAGKIKVNGQTAVLGQIIDPKQDTVEFRGEVINQRDNLVYYALYKPKGVISTAADEQGRQSVIDLVPNNPRVFPVGRLDADSEGLIILTNDGGLAQRLTHPSFEHEKEYCVETRITNQELRIKSDPASYIKQRFMSGLLIDGRLMKADRVESSLTRNLYFVIRVTLHTGYNRQIRKMCAKIGLEVRQLIRVRVAKLSLKELNLKPGDYKKITKNQIV